MLYAFLFIMKTMSAVSVLLFSNLIAECTLISKSFIKPLASYHRDNIDYIFKMVFISAGILFFDLTIQIPPNVTSMRALRMIIVQAVFIGLGFYLLRQAEEKTSFIDMMIYRLKYLKIIRTGTVTDQQILARVHSK